MKINLLPLALAILFLIPFAGADVLMPPLYFIYGASIIFLLIPIILIEGAAAHFLIKRFFKFKASIPYILLAFLAANLFSSIIGLFFISLAIPAYDLLPAVVSAYLITSILESPILYLFLRRKTGNKKHKNKIFNDLIISLKISFAANIFSYILILAILLAFTPY